jgi:bifunctional UDP-N-acetylglucosamine pyrophosphorylase/glucosamine-1-phosphate N-acetyltransferase
MKSSLPKVLHPVAGRPMLEHVLRAVSAVGANGVAVVVGPGREDVAGLVRKVLPEAGIFVQTERRGTAHAVLAAREAIARGYDDLLVVFADTPLVQAATFGKMREELAGGVSVVALGFEAADPTGYGRFIIEGGRLVAIREHKDASAQERQVRTCNAGLMAIDGQQALAILDAIGNSNAQAEFYLTDAVGVAVERNLRSSPVIVSEEEVMGINDKVQLATAEAILQKRLREDAMRAGVTMIAPETVFLSQDTKFGRDVVVEPFVVFGPGVTVADGAVIHSFSHLEGAKVGDAATVGPFARLRPGADLGEKAKVGNFVEVKATTIGADAKVSHLTYLGDASVGAGANIGAGTITCNYDGFDKYRTTIGAGAFIGSNSSLVAPVTIGDGAFVGSGSVITDNVEADALAVARGRQYEKEGWAREFREARKNRPKKR